jgi:hypothetical protein
MHCAQGMLAQALACIGSSAAVFLSYTLLFVVRTRPWWAPQYFIPILGMMLGNAISGVSVGLSAMLEEFTVGASDATLNDHALQTACCPGCTTAEFSLRLFISLSALLEYKLCEQLLCFLTLKYHILLLCCYVVSCVTKEMLTCRQCQIEQLLAVGAS